MGRVTPRRLLIAALLLGAAAQLRAGSPQADAARFEVVSVKPAPSGLPMQLGTFTPGGIWRASNASLDSLFTYTLGLTNPELLTPGRIIGVQGWMRDQHFDIEARAPASATIAQLFPMIRRLLEERFALRTHIEPRPLDVYLLTLARTDGKLGSQLRASAPECVAARMARTDMPATCRHPREAPRQGNDMSMSMETVPPASVAGILQLSAGRPVVDRTGLTGLFDFALQWDSKATRLAPGELATGDSIFSAVQEQLGLKLEPAREPVDVLIIDTATPPQPN
jgi:uncharacterized protein (TIGR03435 family)